MAYLLDGGAIRAPTTFEESNLTQFSQQRSLSGAVNRDYFGSNKRVWTLEYENVKTTDYATIKTIYESYLSSGTAKTWEITETNYDVDQTSVHVDLLLRSFSVKGNSYISNFTLTLVEN